MKTMFSAKPSQIVVAISAAFMVLALLFPLNSSLQIRYPLQLTTTLEKTAYKLKEGVNATLSLKNIGIESIFVYITQVDLYVYNENFILVFKWSEHYSIMDGLYIKPGRLEPGESFDGAWVWWQEVRPYFKYQGPHVPIIDYNAEPGVYYVTGVFYWNDGSSPAVKTSSPYIETPPIKITVA